MRSSARWPRLESLRLLIAGAGPLLLALLCSANVWAGEESQPYAWPELAALRDALKSLSPPIGETRPGDWLARFHEEGQSFALYALQNKNAHSSVRRNICVLPLGTMSKACSGALALAAKHLELYYGLKATELAPLPLEKLPKSAERMNPFGTGRQLNASWIIDELLKPRLPKDAAILAGIAAEDLWPGEDGWNYVFGVASGRVCVLSTKRYGEPSEADGSLSPAFLRRLFATSVHECGHDIGIDHCVAYSCVMCGSNSLEESDRRPLELCAECLPKLVMATGCSPTKRAAALLEFYRKCGLEDEARREEETLKALRNWRPRQSLPQGNAQEPELELTPKPAAGR